MKPWWLGKARSRRQSRPEVVECERRRVLTIGPRPFAEVILERDAAALELNLAEAAIRPGGPASGLGVVLSLDATPIDSAPFAGLRVTRAAADSVPRRGVAPRAIVRVHGLPTQPTTERLLIQTGLVPLRLTRLGVPPAAQVPLDDPAFNPTISPELVLRLGLAGDVNGDFQVNNQDIQQIRSRIGARADVQSSASAGEEGNRPSRRARPLPNRLPYLARADVDGDGRITSRDLDFAQRNLGTRVFPQPLTIQAGLDPSSDPNGDGVAIRARETLMVRTRPWAQVALDLDSDGHFDRFTQANGRGVARLTNLPLADGFNPFALRVVDPLGRRVDQLVTLQRIDPLAWINQATLEAIAAANAPTPVAARAAAMVHLAVFDAINAITNQFVGYRFAASPGLSASVEAAAIAAGHRMLTGLFPEQAARFDALRAGLLAQLPDDPARLQGAAAGIQAAEALLADRLFDGAATAGVPLPGPTPVPSPVGLWEPTPPQLRPALLPRWGQVRPFGVAIAAGILGRPPALDDPAYAQAWANVRDLGSAVSTQRDADQSDQARFWDAPIGTTTPVGQWNRVADAWLRHHPARFDPTSSARVFALLNTALADAAILAWSVQYDEQFWRPISAIRRADEDGNPQTASQTEWTPLLITPASPSFPSDHALLAGAAETVLTSLLGDQPPPEGFTLTPEGPAAALVAPRRFETLAQAVNEAAQSRVLGGVNFPFDVERGLQAGRALGRATVEELLQPPNLPLPSASLSPKV